LKKYQIHKINVERFLIFALIINEKTGSHENILLSENRSFLSVFNQLSVNSISL